MVCKFCHKEINVMDSSLTDTSRTSGEIQRYKTVIWKLKYSYQESLLLVTSSRFWADDESIIAVFSLPWKRTLSDLGA